jgi:hypothetical protein
VDSAVGIAVRTIQVCLAGGGPTARGSLAVEVTLRDGGRTASVLIEGDRDSARVNTEDSGTGPVMLVTREFFASGEIHEQQWTEPGELVVVGLDGRPVEPEA